MQDTGNGFVGVNKLQGRSLADRARIAADQITDAGRAVKVGDLSEIQQDVPNARVECAADGVTDKSWSVGYGKPAVQVYDGNISDPANCCRAVHDPSPSMNHCHTYKDRPSSGKLGMFTHSAMPDDLSREDSAAKWVNVSSFLRT
jgi:hypothetical protein